MRRVLMIAFHFPPAAMGSGHLRTLGFVRYLPARGWNPIVLSACAMAYPQIRSEDLGLVPAHCRVHRVPALDVRRHMSLRGRYPGFLAQPDGWASWWPAAVFEGLRLIRKYRVDAIWSTYPIMTAHAIGYTLSRFSGRPWLADFRDPVASSVEAGNPCTVAAQLRMQRRVLARAGGIVFTTPGARHACAAQFPEAGHAGRLHVIPNGYDESVFADFSDRSPRQGRRRLHLVHAGLLYRDGRDPLPFFTALSRLKKAGVLHADDLRVVLRASGPEGAYREDVERLDIADMVELAPAMPHREALLEQAGADALLLFQGRRFNRQIPAKVYEYLRVGRPILALADAGGETAALLRRTGGAELLPMDDASAIENRLPPFLCAVREQRAVLADASTVAGLSRAHGAGRLAELLDALVMQGSN